MKDPKDLGEFVVLEAAQDVYLLDWPEWKMEIGLTVVNSRYLKKLRMSSDVCVETTAVVSKCIQTDTE